MVATFVMDRNTYWVNVTSDTVETVQTVEEKIRTETATFASQSEVACVLVSILLLLFLLFMFREVGMFEKMRTIWKSYCFRSFVFQAKSCGCFAPSDSSHYTQNNAAFAIVLVKHVTMHPNPV